MALSIVSRSALAPPRLPAATRAIIIAYGKGLIDEVDAVHLWFSKSPISRHPDLLFEMARYIAKYWPKLVP